MKVAFNMNDRIHVKLTDVGLAELERQWEELRQRAPSIGPWKAPVCDADGYSTHTMWRLMQELGHMMIMGTPLPFEVEVWVEPS